MAAFADEGRVAPATLVGARPEGPFAPAQSQAALRGLFGETVVEPPAVEPVQSLPAADPVQPARPPGPARGRRRPLLVWAALATADLGDVETLLGVHGPFVPIHQPGFWLVLTHEGPQALRNDLTRRLKGGDRLMVVEASLGSVAWFNLGAETDRLLRRLWAEAGETP
jgi:hypothetical protein